MAISDKILNLRKEHGLSQEAFAEKLGVSRQSVSKWESGSAMPDIDKIVAISELFGVTTDYLLKKDEPDTAEYNNDYNAELDDTVRPENPIVMADFEGVTENVTEASPEYTEEAEEVFMPVEEIKQKNAPETKTERGKKNGKLKKIIAWVLVLCIMLSTLCVTLFWGQIKELWWSVNGGKVEYPYVLVHGLGGWGEDSAIDETVNYWGSTSGDLAEMLREEGYEVITPSVGPVSSAWDRACELYAQLTGTRVDYGEAHSKEHNHERFGRTYDTPLVENWGERENGGQVKKINLIGHSFGGTTVRLLTSLLEYGSEAEREASGDDVSPLFEGDKGKWVFSVTTLCSPHNGSTLTEVINDSGSVLGSLDELKPIASMLSLLGLGDLFGTTDILNTTDLLFVFCMLASNFSEPENGIYDLMLDQFGIEDTSATSLKSAFDKVVAAGNDHAAYDLSPDGAAKLNKTIKTVKNVYYFSYAYSSTYHYESKYFDGHVPSIKETILPLQLTALGMGYYTGETEGGIVLDESWQENDGLVSVISAQKPNSEEGVYHKKDVRDINPKEIEKGIWNVSKTLDGHHGTVIGLAPLEKNSAKKTVKFYTEHFAFVETLKR